MSNVIDVHVELEKGYHVMLTELEMFLLAKIIRQLFRKKADGKERQSKEDTYHMMLVCDKFSHALSSQEFTLIKKQRLPIA